MLHRAFQDLPVGVLACLLRGVRRHADSLVPGSLQSGRGGCAVGMMLHELRGTRPGRRLRWRALPGVGWPPRLTGPHADAR